MIKSPLDLDTVQTFVRIAELGSFTRAAEAAGATQSAVSLKLKRLEERLGSRLLERTPRYIQLTTEGATFLGHARELLAAHDRALSVCDDVRQRLRIGISDHVAGPELPKLIAHMNGQDSRLLIEVRIGTTGDLLQRFDRRELDAAIVRFQDDRTDGHVLAEEGFGWYAAPTWHYRADEPLPVATMDEPCGVRLMAGERLDAAGIAWTEVFVGGGVTAVSAAVMAGLGVSALAGRMLLLGAVDVGPALGLPDLPRLPVVLHTRIKDGPGHDTLNALSAAFRNAVKS